MLSPCDTCHSLIGAKLAQSLCSLLSASWPSLTISSSWHLDHPSLYPLAYKLNPLPSLKWIHLPCKVIMLFWEHTNYQNTIIMAKSLHDSIVATLFHSPHPSIWSLSHTCEHIYLNQRQIYFIIVLYHWELTILGLPPFVMIKISPILSVYSF